MSDASLDRDLSRDDLDRDELSPTNPQDEISNTEAQSASFDDEPSPEQAALDVESSDGAALDAQLAAGEA